MYIYAVLIIIVYITCMYIFTRSSCRPLQSARQQQQQKQQQQNTDGEEQGASLSSYLNSKSFDELKSKLNMVLEANGPVATTVRKAEEEDLPWSRKAEAPQFKESSSPKFSEDDDDDEGLEFFKKLANK